MVQQLGCRWPCDRPGEDEGRPCRFPSGALVPQMGFREPKKRKRAKVKRVLLVDLSMAPRESEKDRALTRAIKQLQMNQQGGPSPFT